MFFNCAGTQVGGDRVRWLENTHGCASSGGHAPGRRTSGGRLHHPHPPGLSRILRLCLCSSWWQDGSHLIFFYVFSSFFVFSLLSKGCWGNKRSHWCSQERKVPAVRCYLLKIEPIFLNTQTTCIWSEYLTESQGRWVCFCFGVAVSLKRKPSLQLVLARK
jgi:hypothetical protein